MAQDRSGSSDGGSRRRLYLNRTHALLGGATATVVMAAIALTIGAVSGLEARVLLEAVRPPARFLFSSAATASATTLALMLTLLGLSADIQQNLKDAHYHRIQQIALIDCIAFIASIVLLLTLVIPFGEADAIPIGWYSAIYYFIVGGSALLGGIMVAVILMIYSAVREMADVFVSDARSRLVADEPESRS